jgi:predicted  nucleic acid-binding Zn-ribbon protein
MKLNIRIPKPTDEPEDYLGKLQERLNELILELEKAVASRGEIRDLIRGELAKARKEIQEELRKEMEELIEDLGP